MKKLVLAVVLVTFVLCGFMSTVFAQEKASGLKIAYVDVYKAVNESEQGKRAKTELESIIKSKQGSLESKGRAIERLRSEIEKQSDMLSAEAKKSKAEEYERLTREYQRNATDSQNEVRKREGELTGRILKTIGEIVVAIGREGKYTLILEKQQILFADQGLDITGAVIQRLDSSSSAAPAKSKKRK
jgi:outer membrane protein